MSTMVVGLFKNSKDAGEAIADLKEKGYTNDVSLVARGEGGQVSTETVKESGDGVTTGALTGALAGALAGVVAVALPGGPLLLAGPVALTWGASGAALGALSGGLLGGLMELGIEESQAEVYERRIMAGDVMVSVSGDDDKVGQMVDIMHRNNVDEIIEIGDEDV